MRRRGAAAAAGVALVILLAACSASAPPAPPTPTPTGLFASDEEALAAATNAYLAYTDTVSRLLAAPQNSASALKAIASAEIVSNLEALMADLSQSGRHVEGSTSVDSFSLRQVSAEEVVIGLCLDLSGSRLIDAEGTDVTNSDRATRQPFVATLFWADKNSPMVVKDDPWSGENYC